MSWHQGGLTAAGLRQLVALTSRADDSRSIQQVVYITQQDTRIRQIWWLPGGPAHPRDITDLTGANQYSMNLTSYVVEADGLMVVHAGSTLGIEEFWWHGGDGAPGTGNISAGPVTGLEYSLASHYLRANDSHHVFCVAGGLPGERPGHLHEFRWQGQAGAAVRDLTRLTGAPLAESSPHSHVVLGDSSNHVFYTAAGHLIEIHWTDDDVGLSWRDLNAVAPGAPLVVGAPTGYSSIGDGAQHVYVIDEGADVIEFAWEAGDAPTVRNLTNGAVAPLAASTLASHEFPEQGTFTHHVFYIGANQHVNEIWWFQGGAPAPNDLHVNAQAPLANPIGPVSHVLHSEQTQHVFYQAVDGRIVELWFGA